MGVEAKFSTLLTEAGKDYITLNKTEKVDCDLLVWTGGVRSCKLPLANLVLESDKKDRIMITDFLNVKKFPNVFVCGDNSCFMDPASGKAVPQTAQEAIHQAKLAAKNIYRLISFKPLLPYHPAPLRYVIPVSGKYAIMYTPYLVLSGFAGWVMRRLADLRYFLSILPFFKALRFWLYENMIFMKND
jgi:NADH dehydrogenase